MRREVLQAGLRQILIDLEESGMSEMLEKMALILRNPGKAENPLDWFNFSVITSYISKVQTYNDAEKHVFSILGLTSVADPLFWQGQLKDYEAGTCYDLFQKVQRSNQIILPILSLLDRDYNDLGKNESFLGDDVLVQTVILSDEGGQLSSPMRIVELITAVQQIYAVIAEADGISDASLAIVGMDSGSEKSFDFLGLARLMHEFRETVQMVYNMITFHKQNVTLKNLQVAGEAMAVVGKIAKLEKSKAISEDDASRMKQRLFAGLERFSATGAYTQEMDAPHLPPALAMRPQPRMLTGPAENIVRQGNDAVNADPQAQEEASTDVPVEDVDLQSANEFSASELEAAVRLLRTAKEKSSDNSEPKGRTTAKPVRKPRRIKPIV